METIKKSDTTLEVTIEIVTPTVTKKTVYDRDFIEKQIIDITAQRDEMIRLKEAELKECTDILKEMDKVGIVSTAEVVDTLQEEGII